MWAVLNVDAEEIWSGTFVSLIDATDECKRQERYYGWSFKVVRVEGPKTQFQSWEN